MERGNFGRSSGIPRLSTQAKLPGSAWCGCRRSLHPKHQLCGKAEIWFAAEHALWVRGTHTACSLLSLLRSLVLLWWTQARSKDEAWIKRCHEYSPLTKSVFCNQDCMWERSNLTLRQGDTLVHVVRLEHLCTVPTSRQDPCPWFSATENNQPKPIQIRAHCPRSHWLAEQ